MGLVYLIVAILFEVSGTTCMKFSEGFKHVVPSAAMFVFYLTSLGFLTLALKSIDVGIAYATWSGVGTALIATIGIYFFKEPATAGKFFFITLIIVGAVGLNVGSGGH